METTIVSSRQNQVVVSLLRMYFCLFCIVALNITGKAYLITQLEKAVDNSCMLAVQAQYSVNNERRSVSDLQDTSNATLKNLVQLQTDIENVTNEAEGMMNTAQAAVATAEGANYQANSAPHTPAKQTALSYAQNATEFSNKALAKSQVALNAVDSVNVHIPNGTNAVAEANRQILASRQELENAQASAELAIKAHLDAQASLEKAKHSITIFGVQSQARIIDNLSTEIHEHFQDTISSINHAIFIEDSAEEYIYIAESAITDTNQLIEQIKITLSDASTAIADLESAVQATTTAVEKSELEVDFVLTPEKGAIFFGGHKETYYTERILPGYGLKIPGRHTDEAGLVRDKDNYICVASSDLPKGTIVATSWGQGKVYDTGCWSGIIDIYTNW